MNISGICALTNQASDSDYNPVRIKIERYRNTSGQETKYEKETERVLTGQVISFVPKVKDVGINCYLRVQVNYVNQNTNFLDYVTNFSDELVKHGEYYYLERVFNATEELTLFDTIKIPEDIRDRITDGKIKLEIIAQAIQADGFEPDYSLEDPWKGVKPEKNISKIVDLDDETEEDKETDTNQNPKTGSVIDIYIITFIASAIGLIIVMILYRIEISKEENKIKKI